MTVIEEGMQVIKETLGNGGQVPRKEVCRALIDSLGVTLPEAELIIRASAEEGVCSSVGGRALVLNGMVNPTTGSMLHNVRFTNARDYKMKVPRSQWWGPYPRLEE